MPFALATVGLTLGTLAFGVWFWRSVARGPRLPVSRAILLVVLGAILGGVCGSFERWALEFVGISTQGGPRGALVPTLATILFFAPLEEGLKVTAVWPYYVRRQLTAGRVGAAHAVLATSGFAAAELILSLSLGEAGSWLGVARGAIALPAHFFFAGLWGYTLGGTERDRWFGAIWIASALVHGTYDHIVFGRGPAFLVVVVPLLLLMTWGVVSLLRGGPPQSGRISSHSLFSAVQLGTTREAFSTKGRPLMLHWIFAGALVTLGVMLVFLGLAVYSGHQWGVDFSLADEVGVRGAVPIALLGAALLAAFPFSAYLVARASGAESVLEPAWATGAAIVIVLVLFSVTEPTALVVALGIAPVGFLLACAGAWLGLERH